MLQRTLVFVDTSYLLASFYNSWETGARSQLEIDLPKVVDTLNTKIENQLSQPIHRQYWYDGIPDSGPHRYQRALRTCDGVQLRSGQLIEWGDRRTQKGVDTRLVADMVLAGVHQQCSDMVLVSGDADMIPGVNEAALAGSRVHLYGFGWDSMSSALRHFCDTTTILDPREDFADTMKLEVLEGPIPPVVRNKPEDQDDQRDDPAAGQDVGEQPPSTDPEKPEAPATPTAAAMEEADATSQAEHPRRSADATPSEPSGGEDRKSSGDPCRDSGSDRPKPSMMAKKRKLRSRYVPLPNEVWASAGFQTPYDVGQQYAVWWYSNAATTEQRDNAHMLSGGGLPPEVDRPLLQFACETLHEYTLSETQRVSLRDGFHAGIRGVLMSYRRE